MLVLANFCGLTGVWASLPITELKTLLFAAYFLRQYQKASKKDSTMNSAI
ncbi:hypothetical protein [Enterococcus avium]|nr:hypothetical protein [Enterococcus avium]